MNALVASDYALLSTQAQYFSLQGVEQAMEVVNLAKDSLNPDLELLGIVLNIANMRTKHARQTLESLREEFGDKVFRSVIRQSVAYAESAERAVPILDYRPGRGQDYLSLAGEVLRRIGKPDLLADLDELSAAVVPAGAAGLELRDVGADWAEGDSHDLGPVANALFERRRRRFRCPARTTRRARSAPRPRSSRRGRPSPAPSGRAPSNADKATRDAAGEAGRRGHG